MPRSKIAQMELRIDRLHKLIMKEIDSYDRPDIDIRKLKKDTSVAVKGIANLHSEVMEAIRNGKLG